MWGTTNLIKCQCLLWDDMNHSLGSTGWADWVSMNCQERRHPSCRNLKLSVPAHLRVFKKTKNWPGCFSRYFSVYAQGNTNFQVQKLYICMGKAFPNRWRPGLPALLVGNLQPTEAPNLSQLFLLEKYAVLPWSSLGTCHNFLFQLLTQLGAQKQNDACPPPLSFGTVPLWGCTHSLMLTCWHTNLFLSILPEILFAEETQG